MSESLTPKSRFETSSLPACRPPPTPPPIDPPIFFKGLDPPSNMSCCHTSGISLGWKWKKEAHVYSHCYHEDWFYNIPPQSCRSRLWSLAIALCYFHGDKVVIIYYNRKINWGTIHIIPLSLLYLYAKVKMLKSIWPLKSYYGIMSSLFLKLTKEWGKQLSLKSNFIPFNFCLYVIVQKKYMKFSILMTEKTLGEVLLTFNLELERSSLGLNVRL